MDLPLQHVDCRERPVEVGIRRVDFEIAALNRTRPSGASRLPGRRP